MKRIILLPIIICILFSLAGCESAPVSGTPEEDITTEAATEATTETPTEATTEAPTEAPTEATTEAPTEATTEAPTEAPAEPMTQPSVPTTDGSAQWNLILVNPWNSLPEGFSVELADMGYGHYIDARAFADWQAMFDAAYADGVAPVVCSSYRTHATQTSLYWNKVDQYLGYGYGEEEAQRLAGGWVAVPGTSEHQLGLALDIVDTNYRALDTEQENTDAQKWLMAHSYEYGFILRYPSDKSHVTGINYEPWHYRYVGRETAKQIYDSGLCLEEYLSE